MRRLFVSILLSSMVVQAEVLVSGVIRDDKDETSITKVRIKLESGREIAQTNADGRFEFPLPSSNTVLILEKPGYLPKKIRVSDLSDPQTAEIFMHGTIQSIDTTQVIGIKESTSPRINMIAPTAVLEKYAGLKPDLNDQLAQIPGMVGQEDFNGHLSYQGSRPTDLNLELEGMKLPWPQHLDFGFPGNSSGISPKVVGHYQLDPMAVSGQAGAGSLILSSADMPKSDWDVDLLYSNVTTEAFLAIPTGTGSGFVADFRYMLPSVLENLGERFFAANPRLGQDQCTGSNCYTQSNIYDLSAYDAYVHYQSQDSTGAKFSLSGFLLQDQYHVQIDSNHTNLVQPQYLDEFGGHQNIYASSIQNENSQGDIYSLEYSYIDRLAYQRDTLPVWHQANVSDSALLFEELKQSQVVGGHGVWNLESHQQFKVDVSWESVDIYDSVLTQPFHGSQSFFTGDLIYAQNPSGSGLSTLWDFGISGVSQSVLPGGIVHLGLQDAGTNWSGNWINSAISRNWSLWDGSHDPDSKWEQNIGSQMRVNFKTPLGQLGLNAYGHYLMDPEMPNGEWILWRETDLRSGAWNAGASVDWNYQYKQDFRIQSQWSHVDGGYTGTWLAWSENRLLDEQTHIRYYPLSDTNFSIILSHRASLGKPLYLYALNLDPMNPSKTVMDQGLTTDLYRTDLRMEVDIISKMIPLKRGRLFFEVDNLFAELNSPALKFLGSDNTRQRGWASVVQGNQLVMTPYIARGMGLFFMFGVDADFGI